MKPEQIKKAFLDFMGNKLGKTDAFTAGAKFGYETALAEVKVAVDKLL